MNRVLTLCSALAVFIITCGFQIRPPIPLKNTTNITLKTNEDVLGTFEAIAHSAGLNVLFGRNFRPSTPEPFSVDNKSVTEALDLFSKQTKTFWTIWEPGTIFVAEDNENNRRDYERQFIATIALPRQQDPQPVLDTVKGATAAESVIVLRDTLAGIEKNAAIVAEVTNSSIEPRILGATTEVFLSQRGTGLRSTGLKRSQLRVPGARTVSLNMTSNVRTMYENLARMAGLNITFGRNIPARSASFRVENADLFDALDSLALQTSFFWQPIDANTIQILEDTPQNRRDYELHQLEVIRLSEGTTPQRLNDVVRVLRAAISLRGIYQYEPGKAIVLHDTPANLLVAEDLVATLEGTPSISKAVITDSTTAFSETGSVFHTVASKKALLNMKVTGALRPIQSTDLRTLYESIAQVAGLGVVFGPRFPAAQNAMFHFENMEVIDALDLLAVESSTFWQPLDDHTIMVLTDTQQNRRDFETHVVKTLLLPVTTTPTELTNLMNVLRTALTLRGVYQSMIAKAIVIHDTPARVEVVERLIRQLVPNPNAIVAQTVPAPGFSESRSFISAPVARSQLTFTNTGAISLQVNQDRRGLYNVLAGLGGLTVNFDARFDPGAATPTRLEGTDVVDALDRLSLETGTYWAVVDSKTILVAPDTSQVRQQLEPQVTRTVGVKTLTAGLVGELVSILRTALSMREVRAEGSYSITMKDTLQRVAIAEQVIANLDRP